MRDSRHRKPVQVGPRCHYHGGSRDPDDIRVIVIHDAEAPSNAAKGVANYGASSSARASWHFVVDDNILIRQLADDVIAWCAPGANSDGLHIELCGYARYSKYQWYLHQSTLKRGAWQVARWCLRYGIPPDWLTDVELAGSKKGLATHAQVSRVFKRSDHTDPGKSFPLSYFQRLVRRRMRWLSNER